MRDYAKISPQFWTGTTGRALREDPNAIIVAMYLMTSPHANMIGLYHLPKLYLAHETGLTIEGASEGLQRCIEGGFCTYDDASEHVFVHEMARFQIGDALSEKDKRCKGVENELEKAPKGALQLAFREKYTDAFHLKKDKGLGRGLQDPPKPRAGTGAGTGARESERAPATRGTRLPADWKPDETELRWARDARPGIDASAEAERFADYWHGVAGAKAVKADWPATWRNWIRRADEQRHARSPAPPFGNGSSPAALRRLA